MKKSRLARRIAAALGIGPGAAFAALLVPGPCTTFDGVVLDSGAADGSLVDAPPGCDAPVAFAFDPVPEAGGCPDFVRTNCCAQQATCRGQDACAGWIACSNACPFDGARASCQTACGTPSIDTYRLFQCYEDAGVPAVCAAGQGPPPK